MTLNSFERYRYQCELETSSKLEQISVHNQTKGITNSEMYVLLVKNFKQLQV